MRTSNGLPLVSVVTPTCNCAHFLPAALDSALGQGEPNVEIVVVDDGSTDGTREALAAYGNRVRAIHQANAGLSAARNVGLREARGDLLLFLDADDLLGPGCIKAQREFLMQRPEAGLAVCENRLFTASAARGAPVVTGSWRLFRRDLDLHLCHFNIAPPHAFMARREAVLAVGAFDQGLGACEDHDFWFRCAALGHKALANRATRVFYRRHAASMSANLENQRAHDAILHLRIAAALLHKPGAFASRLAPALVACAAGCLHTANLILPQAREKARELKEMAARCLEGSRLAPGESGADGYFSARLRLGLAALKGSGLAGLGDLARMASEALPDPELEGMGHDDMARVARERHDQLL